MARVRDRASPTPEQILRGAKEAFLAHGYELATMDKIAEYAGVARASVYNHFSSKEALFTELMQTGCRDFVAHVTRTDPDLQDDPLAELRSTAVQFLSVACQPENINFYRLVIAESARFPWLAEAFYNSGPLQVKNKFEALLARASAGGVADVRDPLSTADQLLGVLLGGFYLRRVLKLPGDTLGSSIESIVVDALDVLVPVPGGQRIASSPGFDGKLRHRAPLTNIAARRNRSGKGQDNGRLRTL